MLLALQVALLPHLYLEEGHSNLPSEGVPDDVVYLSDVDERANTLTHALGTGLSLLAAAGFWEITKDESLGLRISCLVFCLSMFTVYFFSTLSHAVKSPAARNRLRAWDQGTIYLLISGTYCPFVWQGSPAGWRGVLMAAIWIAAAAGFYSKVLAKHRVNSVSTWSYLLLGWLPAIPLVRQTPTVCVWGMIAGGVSYTIGVVFLIGSKRFRFSHAIWHIWVMIGSAWHCWAIYRLTQLA